MTTKLAEQEAAVLTEDVQEINAGAKAFVRLGLRLIVVKRRSSHGEFIPWLEENVPHLQRRQLYNAISCARHLLKATNSEISPKCATVLQICDDHLAPFEELIAGKSIRGLLTLVREERSDQAEADARAKCEAHFANDPAARDEWEPRVVGGELTWCQAVRGMAGQGTTKAKTRNDADYQRLIPTSIKTLQNGFDRWDSLPDETRLAAVAGLKSAVTHLPDDALTAAGLQRI